MNKRMIDIIDANGTKLSEICASACSTEVANKMKKEGISSCKYQFGTYKAANGVNRNCWRPVRGKSLAQLISVTHNL